jgi:hypothetical protein
MAAITATSHRPEFHLVSATRKTSVIFWLQVYPVPANRKPSVIFAYKFIYNSG